MLSHNTYYVDRRYSTGGIIHFMSISTRLSDVFELSEEIVFDNSSKFVFFSDIHRGDNSKADNFAPNKDTYLSALDYYHKNGYYYIEIGDGDELWENDRFSPILKAHQDTFLSIRRFHNVGRLCMIFGNHDIFKRNRKFVKKTLFEYYNPESGMYEPLFNNIKMHEGLILRYRDTQNKIFIVHGHQGDLINDRLWPLARFLVRYVWRRIEYLRLRSPISPSRSILRRNIIENGIINWVKANNQMIIAGHTHHAMFARPGEPPYFNDGCCVHPGYITCIEIDCGSIMLVKWEQKPELGRNYSITREIVKGPHQLSDFF